MEPVPRTSEELEPKGHCCQRRRPKKPSGATEQSMYPSESESTVDNRSLIRWQHSLRALLTWYLGAPAQGVEEPKGHVAAMIADHLSLCHGFVGSSQFATTEVCKTPRSFELAHYLEKDPDYLSPISDLHALVKTKMQPFLKHFLLHGSMATGDYRKGWSDVDTFVIVKKDTIADPTRLDELRRQCVDATRLMLRIDPLQHHGLILATEYDLEYYPSVYMPPVVFDEALSLLDTERTVRFHVRESRQEAINKLKGICRLLKRAEQCGVLEHHAYGGEYLHSEYKNASNGMYQFKYLLALVMSLPALFLDAVGQSCQKRDSFGRCQSCFRREWVIVHKASEVRDLWPNKEPLPFLGNRIPMWVQKRIGKDYFGEAFALANAMAQESAASAGLTD